MKKILLCSIALLALATFIACKNGENTEDKRLNEDESIQADKEVRDDTQDEAEEADKEKNENIDNGGTPDTDSNDEDDDNGEQKGHPPNSYKDIDYDVKSIHE